MDSRDSYNVHSKTAKHARSSKGRSMSVGDGLSSAKGEFKSKAEMEEYFRTLMAEGARSQHELELKQDIGSLLEDAGRTHIARSASKPNIHGSTSAEQFDFKAGFWNEGDYDTRHRNVGEKDFDNHRFNEYPRVHQTMSTYGTRPNRRKRPRADDAQDDQTKDDALRHASSEQQQKSPPVKITTPHSAPDLQLNDTGSTYPSVFGSPVDNREDGSQDNPAFHANQPDTSYWSDKNIIQEEETDDQDGASVPKETAPEENEKVLFHLGFDGDEESHTDSPSPVHHHLHPSTAQAPHKTPSSTSMPRSGEERRSRRHSHHHHHHHHHHLGSANDLQDRRHVGSEVKLQDGMRRVDTLTETEEASSLAEPDLEYMADHRLGHSSGLRRRKISSQHNAMASIVHISSGDKSLQKPVDHSPHELFVELDELRLGHDKKHEWRETARWIKFEEDVEEGAGRWGKPHVASLNFLSLVELNRCLQEGALLLDLDVDDLQGLVNAIADELLETDQVEKDEHGAIVNTLLLKHKHVMDKHHILPRNWTHSDLSRRFSTASTPDSHRKGRKGSKYQLHQDEPDPNDISPIVGSDNNAAAQGEDSDNKFWPSMRNGNQNIHNSADTTVTIRDSFKANAKKKKVPTATLR